MCTVLSATVKMIVSFSNQAEYSKYSHEEFLEKGSENALKTIHSIQ